jgi:2-iminobutanoate/2-iminopropanoate deaminase
MGIQIQRVPAATGGSYSDVVDISGPGRWIMVSGQVAFGPDGTVRGSMEEQAHGCFDHIERALAKVGGSLSHVVRITSFTTTLEDYAGFSTATVQVAGLLAGAQIEIDAVAFIPA